jgi:hypothetical protein
LVRDGRATLWSHDRASLARLVSHLCPGGVDLQTLAAVHRRVPGPELLEFVLADHEIEVVVAEPFAVPDGDYSSRLFNAVA